MTLAINDTQHNKPCAIKLRVVMLSFTFYLLLCQVLLSFMAHTNVIKLFIVAIYEHCQ